MTKMMKKYTTKNREFKFAPGKRYIEVYIDGRLDGFIWNTDTVIFVNGDEVVSSEFFK